MYRLPAVRTRPCRPCRRHLRSHPCLCSTNWQAAWRPDPRHGSRVASYRTSCRIGSMYNRRRTCIPVCTGNTRSFRKNRTGRGRPCRPRGTALRTSWPGRPARTTVTWPPWRPMRFRTLSDVSCSSSLSSHLRATSASCGDCRDGPIRRARTDGRTICLFALLLQSTIVVSFHRIQSAETRRHIEPAGILFGLPHGVRSPPWPTGRSRGAESTQPDG